MEKTVFFTEIIPGHAKNQLIAPIINHAYFKLPDTLGRIDVSKIKFFVYRKIEWEKSFFSNMAYSILQGTPEGFHPVVLMTRVDLQCLHTEKSKFHLLDVLTETMSGRFEIHCVHTKPHELLAPSHALLWHASGQSKILHVTGGFEHEANFNVGKLEQGVLFPSLIGVKPGLTPNLKFGTYRIIG